MTAQSRMTPPREGATVSILRCGLALGLASSLAVSAACGGAAASTPPTTPNSPAHEPTPVVPSTEGGTVSTNETKSTNQANKEFMQKLFSGGGTLFDFPDRVDPNLTVYQPASLPFGGAYHGLAEFQRVAPKLAQYYDFSRLEPLGLYGDGDVIFTNFKVGVAGTQSSVYLAEKFTFRGTKVVEIRAHICQ
jgi:hypothetical protein